MGLSARPLWIPKDPEVELYAWDLLALSFSYPGPGSATSWVITLQPQSLQRAHAFIQHTFLNAYYVPGI